MYKPKIYIKYNSLASFTKRIYSLFNSHPHNSINNQISLLNGGMSDRSLRDRESLNRALKGIDLNPNQFLYFSIDDKNEFIDDPVTILDDLYEKYDIEVLFVLRSPYRRLLSILQRDKYIDKEPASIDEYVHQSFVKHLENSNECPENIATSFYFDRVFLYMHNFERLVEKHNDGIIKMNIVTEKTLIDNPWGVINHFSLISNYELKKNDAKDFNSRLTKKRANDDLIKSFLIENKNKIDERMKFIWDEIDHNKLDVI